MIEDVDSDKYLNIIKNMFPLRSNPQLSMKLFIRRPPVNNFVEIHLFESGSVTVNSKFGIRIKNQC